jgi:RNA polymerase primary sigma factor
MEEHLIKIITDRERVLLIMRYGLNGNEPMTLLEIGQSMSLTRERVRQIEAKALSKLRKSPYSQHLIDYIK